MTQAKKSNEGASAISLAAITAGAVAAALVIMSIGSIVTIISIGASINSGMQATASMMEVNTPVQHRVAIISNTHTIDVGNFQQVTKVTKTNEKSFYIDAVLREDSHPQPTPTTEHAVEQPTLITKSNHVFS
jgi:hypothetical protein